MYNYFKGRIEQITENSVVIETNGVGYELACSAKTLAVLAVGDKIQLFAHLVVKEDDMSLYGFLEKAEKEMFLKLIAISNIGAKAALQILSGLSVVELINAIANGNVSALFSIKGVGKKTAERVILELKSKISDQFVAGESNNAEFIDFTFSNAAQEAIAALVSLGYNKSEATSAVSKIAGANDMSVEELIVRALKG